MRAVVQRVAQARVMVDGAETARIGKGLLVLLGIAKGDTRKDAELIAKKLAALRVFEDGQGKMNLSASALALPVLLVSQFTLYGDAKKGTRPSFDRAAPGELAKPLYEHVIQALRARNIALQTGIFGAKMRLALVNDGPVTILLDSE